MCYLSKTLFLLLYTTVAKYFLCLDQVPDHKSNVRIKTVVKKRSSKHWNEYIQSFLENTVNMFSWVLGTKKKGITNEKKKIESFILCTSLKNEMNKWHHFFLVVGDHTFSPDASRQKVQIRRKIKCFIPVSNP